MTKNGQWLGVNEKGNHTAHIGSFESKWKKKRRNTTSNENNDGEIKLEVLKIIFKATVAMIMGKILIDNNNNNNNNNNNSNDSKISKWKVDPSDVNICGI